MNKDNQFRTDFLFATSSVLVGAGSIFNLAGNYFDFNTSPTAEIADLRATECDWQMVGADLLSSIKEFEKDSQNRQLCSNG